MQVLSLSTRNFKVGTQSFGPVPLPDGISGVAFRVARCTSATPTVFSNPASTISLRLEASFDGGTTWVPAGGFSAAGGVFVGRGGTEASVSEARVVWPDVPGRLVRGILEVQGATVRTSVAVEVF